MKERAVKEIEERDCDQFERPTLPSQGAGTTIYDTGRGSLVYMERDWRRPKAHDACDASLGAIEQVRLHKLQHLTQLDF